MTSQTIMTTGFALRLIHRGLAFAVVLALSACGGDNPSMTQSGSQSRTAASVVKAELSDVSVSGLEKISEVRVSRTVYDYSFRVKVHNTGVAQTNVALTVTAAGPGTSIVVPTAHVADLPANSVKTSSDTVTLRHDRSLPFDPTRLTWRIETSEVPNEVARGNLSWTSGSLIKVPTTAPRLTGTTISIPANAAIDDVQVQVGFENNPPAPFRPEAQAAQAKAVSPTLVVKVANGGPSNFNAPVTITMPYDLTAAGGLPPAVMYWDETAQRYRATSVIAVDRTAGTVTFRTSHFSRFIAVVVDTLRAAIPSVDTGFRMGTDSILHINFGSYEYGGHCAAFASMSSYYYSLKKSMPLYTLSQQGELNQQYDDEETRTALALTYSLIARKWSSVASSIVIPKATDTGLLMIASMIITGDPLHLVMHTGSDGGHSVTAFAYDIANARFRIYDSNFPGTETSFTWNPISGFGTYSRAASYSEAMFDYIGYASDDTFGAPAQFQSIVSKWETKSLKDYFSNLQIEDSDGIVKPLTYGSAISTKLPYQDNQLLKGKFIRPVASVNPVYLHIYRDGVAPTAGIPIAANGEFTINFPQKLDKKIDITLIVSEHARSINDGFSAFGKFTVEADGKGFFINFGFETGDLTGWNSLTTLRGFGQTFTPTKATIMNVGFDPIARDIPTVVFGKHSLRVNDSTPNYHTTLVSQKATVPLSGNPQLLFKWAAVLEDPQHSPTDQPYVDVVVQNVSKGIEIYRRRYYTSDPSFTGWQNYSGGAWKAIPWQSVTLTGLGVYAGDEILLRIDGADCSLGGHGGYVYIDAEE